MDRNIIQWHLQHKSNIDQDYFLVYFIVVVSNKKWLVSNCMAVNDFCSAIRCEAHRYYGVGRKNKSLSHLIPLVFCFSFAFDTECGVNSIALLGLLDKGKLQYYWIEDVLALRILVFDRSSSSLLIFYLIICIVYSLKNIGAIRWSIHLPAARGSVKLNLQLSGRLLPYVHHSISHFFAQKCRQQTNTRVGSNRRTLESVLSKSSLPR